MNRYRYQFTVTPALPSWVGMKQVELTAADQDEADEKVGTNTQKWLEGWATDQGTSYEWQFSRGDLVIKSGVAHPRDGT